MNDTLVDDDAIRKRFKLILRAEPKFKRTGKYKLRDILLTEPDYNIFDGNTPYAFIKLPEDYQITNYSTGSSEDGSLQQITHYQIGVIVHAADIAHVQPILNNYGNIIRDLLRNNRQLKKPDGTDPIVARSVVKNTSRLINIGAEIEGVLLDIECQIGSAWTVKIKSNPQVSIPLLSLPQDVFSPKKDSFQTDDGIIEKGIYAPGGTFDIEFESNQMIEDILRKMVNSDKHYEITLMRDNKAIKSDIVVFDSLNRIVSYDNLARKVLTANIVE